jgi:3-methyladenine DNA glycosylase AlkD
VGAAGRRIANRPQDANLPHNRIMERTLHAGQLANEIASRLAALSSRTVPRVRSVRREYSRLLAKAPPELVIRIALDLASRSDFTCRWFAYEIVEQHKGAAANLTTGQLLKLGGGIDSWAAVDCFGCYLSGPAWRDGRLSSGVIHGWLRSADHWWRRAALVSTIALSRRGESQDIREAIEICTLAVSDRHEMVVKALSWALREVAKKHPGEAKKFLVRHGNGLAARVTREVQNKIATGLKNPVARGRALRT